MEQLTIAVDFLLTHKLLLTVLIIILISMIKRLVISRIRGDVAFLTEVQRKWMSRTKNGTFILIIVILFMLWQTEISKFALSVTAIAIAFVVASKEIILCFTGSIQRASSRSFVIGDWIEVGKICGEVIEHNLMATVIQEIDLHHGQYHFTGKTATLPNSMFFSYAVKNLNFMKRYVYHEFQITVVEFVNLYPLFAELHEKIEAHCEEFSEVAKRYNSVIEKHAGVDLPGAEPHIHITSGINGEQFVHIMIFCPTEQAIHLEQLIREDFMIAYHEAFTKDERV
ncbi:MULTISPECIES: mechanosensitive ion channel family protein [Shewanella]|uniref:Mechanosensitive ion channel n=1 Tax=Shewanella fidelis TaxID=173509 RepID=A0AAW8NJ09_9GAMM|nr:MULTISPECIES: mechanosensitive ion channel domain-containing protein [Shewanella]MDR8523298.1 mechanosensitive ion channel [Shewanella fidelis]MDW4811376.1 mechanosensitive ion channel [Shewanella fidelis]MDW4815497.1 mechanosensitive ion channel [Shewanella fidelis]MDW4819587.1 mechanosensitive ion channel [Shewanella fidelis]MDW4824439.1 mechanosensitive ion channel [Shewanella fidelis]